MSSSVRSSTSTPPTTPQYPPGVQEIIRDPHKTATNNLAKVLAVPDRTLEDEQRLKAVATLDAVDNALTTCHHALRAVEALIPPRDRAIRVIQSSSQCLQQILDDMYAAISEYFPNRIMKHLIEVPAFRGLCKAMTRLILILNSLEISIASHCHYKDENDIDFMMYQVQMVLDNITSVGLDVLDCWNKREAGQRPGQPLTGRDWKRRRNLIHYSNSQLEYLTRMVIIGGAKVCQEQAARQPLAKDGLNLGKGWGWLRYLRPVGDFGIFGGEASERVFNDDDNPAVRWKLMT